MQSDKAKELSAVVSLASVTAAIIGGAAALMKAEWLPTTLSAMYVALAGALASSVISIVVTRNLRRRRRPKGVFFIYSRKDLAIAKELSSFLRESGFAPWLDVEQLVPGQVWRKAVVKAMQESGVAVVLLSDNMNSSKESQAELTVAAKLLTAKDRNTFPILPIRLDDSEVPKYLAHVQWVNWNDPDAKKQIVLGLSHATGQPPQVA
jgi:hypothetical protein